MKAGEEMNDSNCKYTPGFMTIKTTRLIKKGEELLLSISDAYNRERINDHNLKFDASLDLLKKSTRDKHKQRDELSEDDWDYIQVLDFERQELEVKMTMAKEDFEYWEGRIQETIAKKKNILGGGEDEFSENDRD